MNYEQTLAEVSQNIRKALRERSRSTVDIDTAKVVRAEMARAGRVVTELVRKGLIETPIGVHPWLAIALSERGGLWNTHIRAKSGTLSRPIDDGAPSFTVDSDESVVHWIAHEQHRADGSDYPSIEGAVRNQLVHRHVLLEAAAEWLWKVADFCRPDLVLPVWTIWVVEGKSPQYTCLYSDWHEPFSKDAKHAGMSEIALTCAGACAALRNSLRSVKIAEGTGKDATNSSPGDGAVDGRQGAESKKRGRGRARIEHPNRTKVDNWIRRHPKRKKWPADEVARDTELTVEAVRPWLACARADRFRKKARAKARAQQAGRTNSRTNSDA